MKFKSKKYYLELIARLHVAMMVGLYATGKLVGGQFYLKGELPLEVASQTLGEVNSYDLAWTFLGHSYGYIFFIGISQLAGVICLLFERTKLLGVLILIPIMVNIIMIDWLFFNPGEKGVLVSAFNYLFLCLLILYLNKEKVLPALESITAPFVKKQQSWKEKITTAGIIVGSIAIIFTIEQLLVNLIGH